MNRLKQGVLAGVALCAIAGSASAALQCSDIDYDASVIEQFPEISQACREVVERHGDSFVKLRADVASVRRNVRDSSDVQRVTLKMLDRNDDPLRLIAFRPPRDFTFTVDGEVQTADDMGRGQELRIYVPPDRWELIWSLETAEPFDERIMIEDVETLTRMMILEADEAFAFDSDELTDSGKDDLDEVLAAAGDYVPLVDIVGYTDRIGDDDYNQALSERRANAAKDYLVSQGVPEGRVRAVGKGAADPIVACPGKEGDELKDCLEPNRRAEVKFMVPLVAEGGRAVVTKRYRKPNGEVVNVTTFEDAVVVNPASSLFGRIVDACGADAQEYCADTPIGDGEMMLCLYEHTPMLSDGCETALFDASVLQARRQEQLNVIGDVCSGDLAQHCADVPLVDKLGCLRDAELTSACAGAIETFEGLSY